MEVIFFVCAAAILSTIRAQCLPLTTPVTQLVSPCQSQVVTTSPVVATTIVDNSVSNALANALQLLIVSNLIENTMNKQCGLNPLQAAVAPICDAFPIQASVYSPGIDVITPDYLPYLPYEPVISPCDIIPPCEPVICPEIVPIQSVGCGCGYDNPLIPNYGCENIGCGNFPNCGCDNCYRSLSNILPSILPNLGCGCDNSYRSLSNILPSLLPNLGLPNLGLSNNIGCGCNNFGYDSNPFGSLYACDQGGPIIPEVIFPSAVSTPVSYGYGVPNYPVGVNAGPWNYDAFPNSYYGNNYYY